MRLRRYENQHNWKGLEFPVSIKKIDKFEKNNPGIAVNVLFSKKKSQNIYITRRSERNVKCKKAPYTEKINTYVPSGWWVHSTFPYGDVPNPLKIYRGKDCVEKFGEYIEEEVKQLYETFPQQPMIKLTDVQKREHEAAKKCHICFKEFNDPNNRKVRDHCHYTGEYRRAVHNNCNLKYKVPDHIVFHNLNGYDAHLFLKKLRRRFNKNNIGVNCRE